MGMDMDGFDALNVSNAIDGLDGLEASEASEASDVPDVSDGLKALNAEGDVIGYANDTEKDEDGHTGMDMDGTKHGYGSITSILHRKTLIQKLVVLVISPPLSLSVDWQRAYCLDCFV